MYLDGGTMILLLLMVSSFAVAMPEESFQAETVLALELPNRQVEGMELGSRGKVFFSDEEVDASETETEDIFEDVTQTEGDQDVNGEDLPTPEELRRRRNRRPNVRPVPLFRVGPIRESAANSVPVFTKGLVHRLPPNHASSTIFQPYAEEEASPTRQSSGSIKFRSGSLPDRMQTRQSSSSVQFSSGSPAERSKPSQSAKPPALLPHDIYTSSLNNIQQEKLPEVTDAEQDEDQLRREFHEYLSSHRIDGDKDMLTEESRLFGNLFPNYNRLWNDYRSLRRPTRVQGRHSYGGISRLNNHAGKVRFPNKNYIEPPRHREIEPPYHRDYQYPEDPPHHQDRYYPDEQPPITTTTQQPTPKDIFSIHNMAGPPYYDRIPANITFTDYSTTTTTTSRPTTPRPTTKRPTTRRPTTKRPTTRRPTTKRPTTRRPTTIRPTTTYYEYTTKRPQQSTTSRSFDVWTPFTFQPNYPNFPFDVDVDFGWGTKINNKDRSDDKKLSTTKTRYTTMQSFTPSQRDFVTPGPNADYFTPKKPNFFTTEKSYYSTRAPEYEPDYKSDYDYSNNHRLSMDDEKYLLSNKPKLIPDFPQVRTENNKETLSGTQYERERNIHAYKKFENIRDYGMSENYNKPKEKNRQYIDELFENNQDIDSYRNEYHGNTYKTDINEKKPLKNGNKINFPQIKPKRPIKPMPKQRFVPNTRIHNQGILSKPSMVHKPVRKPPARNPSGRRPAVRMQKFRARPAAVRHVVSNPWILQKDDLEVVGYPGYDSQVITKTTSVLTENRPQRRQHGVSQKPRRQQVNSQNRQRQQLASVPASRPSQPQIPRRPAGFMMQGKVAHHQIPSIRRREPPRRNFFGLPLG